MGNRTWVCGVALCAAMAVAPTAARADARDTAPAVAPLAHEVRALLEPVRALRGALFGLRVALVDAVAAPETRLALEPFRGLEPAQLGWLAERLDAARGRSGDAQNDLAARVGRELARGRTAGEVAGAFRALATEDALKAQSTLSLDDGAIGRLRVDAASLDRLKAAVRSVPRMVERVKASVKAMPRHAARIESLAQDIARKAERAVDGNQAAMVGLALDALTLTTDLQPLLDDLKAAPERVTAIGREAAALGQALERVRVSAPDLLGDVGWPHGLGDLPRFDTGAVVGALAGALQQALADRAGGGLTACGLWAVSALEVTAPANKPGGAPWDAFDGPDLRLDCPTLQQAAAASDTPHGRWSFASSLFVVVQPTTCVLRDADLSLDDDIGQLVFAPPRRAGRQSVRAGGGVQATATWQCIDR